ncbi:hypothetical protein HDU96_007584 [Phlyctochytrium bullatum]|nr:hypothetical protein HDU96_007584 [Phlyctochytrium bullatum]
MMRSGVLSSNRLLQIATAIAFIINAADAAVALHPPTPGRRDNDNGEAYLLGFVSLAFALWPCLTAIFYLLPAVDALNRHVFSRPARGVTVSKLKWSDMLLFAWKFEDEYRPVAVLHEERAAAPGVASSSSSSSSAPVVEVPSPGRNERTPLIKSVPPPSFVRTHTDPNAPPAYAPPATLAPVSAAPSAETEKLKATQPSRNFLVATTWAVLAVYAVTFHDLVMVFKVRGFSIPHLVVAGVWIYNASVLFTAHLATTRATFDDPPPKVGNGALSPAGNLIVTDALRETFGHLCLFTLAVGLTSFLHAFALGSFVPLGGWGVAAAVTMFLASMVVFVYAETGKKFATWRLVGRLGEGEEVSRF